MVRLRKLTFQVRSAPIPPARGHVATRDQIPSGPETGEEAVSPEARPICKLCPSQRLDTDVAAFTARLA